MPAELRCLSIEPRLSMLSRLWTLHASLRECTAQTAQNGSKLSIDVKHRRRVNHLSDVTGRKSVSESQGHHETILRWQILHRLPETILELGAPQLGVGRVGIVRLDPIRIQLC